MTDLSPIAPKLAKLLPMLATDHDGEVLATVRAIGRTLQSAGLDFHALSSALGSAIAVRPVSEPKPETWLDLARWLRDHDDGRLSHKERLFVWDMASRLGMGAAPTEKQANWLRAIYAALQREGAR